MAKDRKISVKAMINEIRPSMLESAKQALIISPLTCSDL
ncbi:MAG: hypothetical protein ACI9SY_000006 [Candidatus Paceibacteria bacterium]|jgi:hypothetical protein